MRKNIFRILCSSLVMAAVFLPQIAQEKLVEAAIYEATTDTKANLLDYIENRDRIARENIVSDEQKQLLADAYKMRNELRNPLDPTKSVPIAVESDDLFYNQGTGDVVANGNVQFTTLDARRIKTDELTGNVDDSTVQIDGKARILQMTPDQARIVLTAYKTQYDYTRGIGKAEDSYGKVGNKYIKAKRIELYPDIIVIYNGTATKCSAEHPDYHLAADRIEIYPDGRMISYNVKYYLGSVVVYQSSKEITDPNQPDMGHMPKIGYSNENGMWISDRYDYSITDRVHAFVHDTQYSKRGNKADGGIVWNTKAAGTFKLYTGIFNDTDNNWIRKSPTLRYDYGHRIADTPFHWSATYENGIWHQGDVHSHHIYYALGLSTDPVKLGTWRLYPSTSYGITDESANSTRTTGFSYALTAMREYDMKYAQYISYEYNKNNSSSSVFDFDNDDFSRRLDFGFSYRMDLNNRFVVGYKWDMNNHTIADIDYYWFHQMHCAELITSYRAKRHAFRLTMQFTPW